MIRWSRPAPEAVGSDVDLMPDEHEKEGDKQTEQNEQQTNHKKRVVSETNSSAKKPNWSSKTLCLPTGIYFEIVFHFLLKKHKM